MIDPDDLDWVKQGGLIPAIIQDARSGEVRMVGYMDRAALEATLRDGFVTFLSRSRGTLWRKGESSGNVLELVDIRADCDGDALLVLATPRGPTCHLGTSSCFGGEGAQGTGFLAKLADTVADRANAEPSESYTARLLGSGTKRVAQKVGEEAVEVALAAASNDIDELVSEAADLLYHLTVLFQSAGTSWDAVMTELRRRHGASSATASS